MVLLLLVVAAGAFAAYWFLFRPAKKSPRTGKPGVAAKIDGEDVGRSAPVKGIRREKKAAPPAGGKGRARSRWTVEARGADPAARVRAKRKKAQAALVKAVKEVSITMYMAEWCGVCRKARRWLRENKLSYREINIARNPAAKRALRRINPRGSIPTFVIDGQVRVGFGKGIWTALVSAAQRRVRARAR